MSNPNTPLRRKVARLPVIGVPKMRRFTLASVVVHVAVFLLVAIPFSRTARPIFAEPIYQVALVEDPIPNFKPPVPTRTITTPKEKAAPQPPKPVKSEPEAIPVPEKQKTEPAKPKPKPTKPETVKKPPEKKAVDPPAQPKVDIPNAPEEPVSVGLVDQRDFKHDYYLELIRGILAREWADRGDAVRNPPAAYAEGVTQTTVHFIIQRDGTITEPEIRASSEWSLYDRASVRAVIKAKLPPLPEAYSGPELGLTVNFQQSGEKQ